MPRTFSKLARPPRSPAPWALVDVPPLHRSSVPAALLLAVACNNPPSSGTDDASDAGTTAASSTSGGPSTPTTTQDPDGTATATATALTTGGPCEDGEVRCAPPDREVCENGAWQTETCPEGQACNPDEGATCQPCVCDPEAAPTCVDADNIDACTCFAIETTPCPPGTACADLGGDVACHAIICNENEAGCADSETATLCNATGTASTASPCPTTEMCDLASGGCMDACTVVAKLESSLGCDFWALDMPNLPPRNQLLYAVALSNPSTKAAAHIRVYDRNKDDQEQIVATGTIDPRDVQIYKLSGTQDNEQGFYPTDAGILPSGIVRGRAFHITSDIPIVATQFNPLGGAKAYSTDASLLLPTHTLGTSYLHMAWHLGDGAGSTLDVVATEDDTIVTITSPVSIPAGLGGLPALTANVPRVMPTLRKHDYIQLSLSDKDLTSARITANAEIAVFGGHSCARIPTDTINGCDHLEEQIFPITTWGEHFLASRAPPRGSEQMTWRVLAAEDGTTVTYDPPVSIGDGSNLDAGKFVEFTAAGDFEITSNTDHPILVAGYLHSCDDADTPECLGDPSMVLLVPAEQWTRDYVFLVDTSYTNNSVKLVRPAGEPVFIGCLGEVRDWTAITPKYESAVVTFNDDGNGCKPGTNTASSELPFGIMVVGEADITSYAYPGGLQLKPINPG